MAILGNNFWEGVIGVVDVYFNNVYRGKTNGSTEITIETDDVDIMYQQDGTKPADKVRTGMSVLIKAVFAEISTTLLADMIAGVEKSGTGESLKIGRSLYLSQKDNEAKVLKLVRLEDDLTESVDPLFMCTFYKAVPKLTSPINYEAATQKNISIDFYVFWDDTKCAFGFSGIESSVI